MKSLSTGQHPLSSGAEQIRTLQNGVVKHLPRFAAKIPVGAMDPLPLEVLQVNIGKMCNQTCLHCHVDAGPDRKERMSREVMEHCIRVVKEHRIPKVDITGGAPEMHGDFRWFVEQCTATGAQVLVRCNLTIIVANKKYFDLPEFYRDHNVEVVSSLPFFSASRTDRQRGDGVFEASIKALKMLNGVGYGIERSGLVLDLVYNPMGAFLPGSQLELEKQFKQALMKDHGISFNRLFAITNMPVSRFLEFLIRSGNYVGYMEKLVQAFNPQAVGSVMCRSMLSVGHDGSLFDCDFNQMLELPVEGTPPHISAFEMDSALKRSIRVDQHCYGCTAGAGSSCGGSMA
ncbi:MAG: arsenosugar biosynthesis radical SAM protein ArsS [Bacteroidota bacterium]|nr:arsenosugar biosynthesis radical SAM protein ArsS [Bacteroidota bacterium]